MYLPDNYDAWELHEAEQNRQLEQLPECVECGNPIQDEHFYLINDEAVCPECLEQNYRKNTEDFV